MQKYLKEKLLNVVNSYIHISATVQSFANSNLILVKSRKSSFYMLNCARSKKTVWISYSNKNAEMLGIVGVVI